jgi:hypothetical protein
MTEFVLPRRLPRRRNARARDIKMREQGKQAAINNRVLAIDYFITGPLGVGRGRARMSRRGTVVLPPVGLDV